MNNRDRILSISKKLGLSHIGSCLSVLPILEEIYSEKAFKDKVGLSGAHSHLAHLVVAIDDQNKAGFFASPPAEDIIKEHGIHCDRKVGCDITGGSLAHSGIALGMALANPDIIIHWIETDGSLAEGSAWEMLRLRKLLKVKNLKVYVNMNGSSALEEIDKKYLTQRLYAFDNDIDIRYTNNGLPELIGVKGHYTVL